MSLENLFGLASAKAIAAVAGATLTVGGTAGIVVAADNAPDATPAVVVEELVEPASHEDEGPEGHANENSPAADIHDFINSVAPEDRDCSFGLGVAAIASKGKAPAAEDVCNRGGGEEEELDSRGEDASTLGADNASDGLTEASEQSGQDVPAGSAGTAGDHPDQGDAPAGGPETGDTARGNAGRPSDG